MIKLHSYGKINLFLDVEGKLPNGYHLIKTIMQSVDIYDEIILNPLCEDRIIIECSESSIPLDEKNTCYRAALLLKETFSISSGIHIYINKKIPQEAGLAGGSGNAAAVIKGLNLIWNLCLSQEEMQGIGVQIGADIPFCLVGGTCLAQGIGDKVTELNDFIWDNILIIKPEFSMSTVFVYKNLDPVNYNLYNKNKILEYISLKDYESTGLCLANTLEKVVEKYHPQINSIKKLMVDNGAVSSLMTGSGSAVFALFKDSCSLKKAYEIARQIYPHTYMTKTTKDGVEFID